MRVATLWENSLTTPGLSFVIPVYGSPLTLATLCSRIHDVCAELNETFEIVLVDDRCPLGSWPIIQELKLTIPELVGVRLSRNFGQHAAIGAGLSIAQGQWIVVMDCDLQDQPEEVPAMLKLATSGGFEVVRARRASRNDSWFRRQASKLFYNILSFMTDTRQSEEIANFGVYHRKVIDAINVWQEETKYFPAIVEWIGFAQTTIDVIHAERLGSKSSYTFAKLMRLALNVITGFSDKPLKLLTLAGLLIALCSFGAASVIFAAHFFRMFSVEGWTSMMLSLWFVGGSIIFGIGLTGLYVGRILVEVKGRPTYILDMICRGERISSETIERAQ